MIVYIKMESNIIDIYDKITIDLKALRGDIDVLMKRVNDLKRLDDWDNVEVITSKAMEVKLEYLPGYSEKNKYIQLLNSSSFLTVGDLIRHPLIEAVQLSAVPKYAIQNLRETIRDSMNIEWNIRHGGFAFDDIHKVRTSMVLNNLWFEK